MKIKKSLILGLGAFSSVGAIAPAFVAQVKNTNTKETNESNVMSFPKTLSDINRRDINTAFSIWDTDPDMIASQMAKPQDAVKNFFPLMGVNVHWVSWQVDDIIGQINYEVTLSKDGQTCDLKGATWGFKHFNPLPNITNKDVVAAYPSLVTGNSTKFASDLLTTTKPKDQTLTVGNIENVDVKWTQWNANDFTGAINWSVSLTKDSTSVNVSGTIDGFKVSPHLNTIDDASLQKNNLIEDFGVKTNATEYASSYLGKNNLKIQLKALNTQDGKIIPNIDMTLTTLSANDSNGTLSFVIVLQKEGEMRLFKGSLSGFLTTSQNIFNIAQEFNNQYATPNQINADKNWFYSWYADWFANSGHPFQWYNMVKQCVPSNYIETSKVAQVTSTSESAGITTITYTVDYLAYVHLIWQPTWSGPPCLWFKGQFATTIKIPTSQMNLPSRLATFVAHNVISIKGPYFPESQIS